MIVQSYLFVNINYYLAQILNSGVPIVVEANDINHTLNRLRETFPDVKFQERVNYLTDNKNCIINGYFDMNLLSNPRDLYSTVVSIEGIIDLGLFIDTANLVFFSDGNSEVKCIKINK